MTSDSANLFCENLVIESGLKFTLSSYYEELGRIFEDKQKIKGKAGKATRESRNIRRRMALSHIPSV